MKATASLKLSMERPPKLVVEGLKGLATTALADFLKLESVMRYAIDEWERKHRARVESTLRARGYLS